MKVLRLSEEQFRYLYVLLDNELKSAGLSSLVRVVDLHNALVAVGEEVEEVDQSQENIPNDGEEGV